MAQGKGSWKTDSGLLDDFDFDVEEAWFGKSEEGRASLHLRGEARQDDGEGNMVVVDEEHELRYSLGDGWEPAKGGSEVQHSAGKTTFNQNAGIGRLINSIVGLGDDVIEEMSSRGETYEAETWTGLSFHIEREKFSFRDRETDEKIEFEVPLVTDFLGTIDVEDKAPAKKAPTKKKSAAKKSGARGGKKKGNAALRKAIIEFGVDYEDHASFVEDVFDEDEFDRAEDLQADEELSADVLDEEGEIWAAVLEAQE